MKIAMTHWNFALYWPRRIAALAAALEARGDSLTVVEVTGKDPNYNFAAPLAAAYPPGTRWIRLFEQTDAGGLRPARVCRALWQVLEDFAPDVVMASSIAFPTGATAVRWARSRGQGVVIYDNVRLEDVPRRWWVNWVKQRIYCNVDAVLTAAPSHSPAYVAWGLPQERVFYGLNVVDNAWYAERAARVRRDACATRAQQALPESFFLGIGRQVPKKNWGGVLAGYAEYRTRTTSSPWGLVLVGEGPERAKLEQHVATHRIHGVVFRPFCSPEQTCTYYGLAQALILPSFYGETWGLVVNEAMACGVPVLVSDRCGCAETLVREGENGWTFPPDNPGKLAEAMLTLAGMEPRQREAMGARSRAIIAEWPLERFAEGALAAIDACRPVTRGFHSWMDSLLLTLWHGRFRPS